MAQMPLISSGTLAAAVFCGLFCFYWQEDLKMGHFLFFIILILCHDFPENSLERELWYLTCHPKLYAWQNSCFWVTAQEALDQSELQIPESPISQKWVIRVANWLTLVWHGWKCSKYWRATIYPEGKIWYESSVLCVLVFANREMHEINIVTLSLTSLVGQFTIYLRSLWCFAQIWAKGDPKEGILYFLLEILAFDFPKSSLKKGLLLYLTSLPKFHAFVRF